jgi:hypothetical protein
VAGPKKTWRSTAAAAGIIFGSVVLIVVGGGAYIIHTHIAAQFVDSASAEAQFDAQRQLLANQQPLIELRGVDVPVVHRRPEAPQHEIISLHVLSYDPRTRKLVRLDLPGWLLRLVSARGSIRLANLELFNDERDRITLEDLERHGPGLIVDARGTPRVLVWTE